MEVNFLIRECINNMIENNLLINLHLVKEECVGVNFQILFQNYEDGMEKLRAILVELLHLKMATVGGEYRADKEYFFGVLEQFMSKDMYLPESLKVARKAAGYHVSRSNWDWLMKLAEPEIEAFDHLHKKLRHDRTQIQEMLEIEAEKEKSRAAKILEEEEEDIQARIKQAIAEANKPKPQHDEESESEGSEEESMESESESEDSSESSQSSDSESSKSESTGGHHHDHHHAHGEGEYEGDKDKDKDDDFDEGKEDKGDKKAKGPEPESIDDVDESPAEARRLRGKRQTKERQPKKQFGALGFVSKSHRNDKND